jgi:hypothetical protein
MRRRHVRYRAAVRPRVRAPSSPPFLFTAICHDAARDGLRHRSTQTAINTRIELQQLLSQVVKGYPGYQTRAHAQWLPHSLVFRHRNIDRGWRAADPQSRRRCACARKNTAPGTRHEPASSRRWTRSGLLDQWLWQSLQAASFE